MNEPTRKRPTLAGGHAEPGEPVMALTPEQAEMAARARFFHDLQHAMDLISYKRGRALDWSN